jgi:preprotein translocase subunit SecG
MDNFTLAVLIGDALVVVSLIILILLDKGKSTPAESPKPTGKRSA